MATRDPHTRLRGLAWPGRGGYTRDPSSGLGARARSDGESRAARQLSHRPEPVPLGQVTDSLARARTQSRVIVAHWLRRPEGNAESRSLAVRLLSGCSGRLVPNWPTGAPGLVLRWLRLLGGRRQASCAGVFSHAGRRRFKSCIVHQSTSVLARGGDRPPFRLSVRRARPPGRVS